MNLEVEGVKNWGETCQQRRILSGNKKLGFSNNIRLSKKANEYNSSNLHTVNQRIDILACLSILHISFFIKKQ